MDAENITIIVNALLEFIRTTGETIVTTGFEISYKKAIADGIVSTTTGGISLILVLYLFATSIRTFTRVMSLSETNAADERAFYASFFKLAIGFILFLIMMFTLPDGIKHLIAPEWYAVNNIIELFK